jgi:hypothetical protein
MKKRRTASARELLRAFQWAREDIPDSGFGDDLELLQSKDLDLSIRLGALLAFDALLLTAAINPISASPGAPLSLDAPNQPLGGFGYKHFRALSWYCCIFLCSRHIDWRGIQSRWH